MARGGLSRWGAVEERRYCGEDPLPFLPWGGRRKERRVVGKIRRSRWMPWSRRKSEGGSA
jgi:hypothetical protein